MARQNIYVNDDLKERMDAVREPVNWSEVAADAFEKKLGEIAQRKKRKTMTDVVQRLRASKLEHESEEEKLGRKAGEEWARDHAAWAELQRSAQMVDDQSWREGVGDAFGLSGNLISHVCPDLHGDRGAQEDFWEAWGEERYPPNEFVWSFFEAAAEVFEKVRKQV